VISADNASFPNLLYLKRTSLHSTVTQATFHGLGHRQSSFDHRRSVIPVYSPLPGDWFVAAFLSNWDQQLTQQVIIYIIYTANKFIEKHFHIFPFLYSVIIAFVVTYSYALHQSSLLNHRSFTPYVKFSL
jgi:hypothetical protein